MAVQYEGILKQVDENGNEVELYPISKNGGIQIVEAESTDGVAYTAVAKGISEFVVGMKITIVPARVSASLTPTLNLNGLGAKYIRMRGTYNTATCVNPPVETWLNEGKPVTLTWEGTQWEVDYQRPAAASIAGTVAIENGGTGVNSLEALKALVGTGEVGSNATVILNNVSLLSITDNGNYYINGPTDCPDGAEYSGYLVVTNYPDDSENYRVIEFTPYNNVGTFYNICTGGEWKDWKKVATADELNAKLNSSNPVFNGLLSSSTLPTTNQQVINTTADNIMYVGNPNLTKLALEFGGKSVDAANMLTRQDFTLSGTTLTLNWL